MPLSKQRFFVGVVVWAGHLGRSSRRPARSCSALPDYRSLQSAAGGQERKSRPSPVPAALFVSVTLRNGVNARPISLAFSQDGRWLATGDMISGTARRPSAEEVLLWDLSAAEKFRALSLEASSIGPVAFSSDCNLVAAVARHTEKPDQVVLFDVSSGSVFWTIEGHSGEIAALAFSPDNKTLVTCGASLVVTEGWERGEIRIWDLEKKTEMARAERLKDPFMTVAFIAGGDRFVTGLAKRRHASATGGELTIWELRTCTALQTSDWMSTSITSLACVPGQDILVAGSLDGALSFWTASDLKPIDSYDARPKRAPRMYVMSLSASRDGRMLAVGMGYWIRGGGEGELQLWDVQERRKCSTVLTKSPRPVSCVRFSPAADLLAAAIGDGRVKVWEVKANQR